MRFLLELIEACRHAIGDNQILGIRIPGSDMVPGGLEVADMQTVAQALESTGQVDYLNVIAYNNSLRFGRALHWPATPARHELFTELSGQIKAVVNMPVLVAGRITHPDQAEAVIANGQADMVAMTRAHITDPEIVRKIAEDRADDIRPCVGANTCIRARFQGRPVRCMHNPYVINRYTDQTPSSSNSLPLVTVVGAGPAGLEASLTAAQRGYPVRLLERGRECGGQLRLWSQVESQKELAAIIDWRIGQLDKLGIQPEFNQTVTADQLLSIDDGIIVMATGAEAVPDTIPGDCSVAQTTPAELLNDPSMFTGRVLIRDQGRGLSALCAAEALAAQGNHVIVVTDEPAVGLDLDLTVRVPAYDRLLNNGVEFLPNHTVAAFKQGAVKLQHVFTEQETMLASINVLVDDHIIHPRDELIKALADSDRVVRSVGDCIAPRTVEAAIHEAAQAIVQLAQA
jgi:NADPH-dependent 2,4-dienoyl-CoA reductase/sulfur reductase-like enzyme